MEHSPNQIQHQGQPSESALGTAPEDLGTAPEDAEWTDDRDEGVPLSPAERYADEDVDGRDIGQVSAIILNDRLGEPRRWTLAILSGVPLLLFILSYFAGGVALANSIGMIFLLALAVAGLVGEFWNFSTRFGVGGLCLHGGLIVWLLHDYLTRYLSNSPEMFGFTDWAVTKACLSVGLFYTFACVGLKIVWGRKVERFFIRLWPETRSNNLLFSLAIVAFIFGISPYFLFTRVPFYEAMYLDFIKGYGDGGTHWTVGKSGGNINFNFGAYIAQMFDVGTLGSLLAVFLVCMRRMGALATAVAFAMLSFWLLRSFGTGARGYVVFLILPVLGAFFMRQHIFAAWQGRRFSPFAYTVLVSCLVLALIAITYQGALRTRGFADIFSVQLTEFRIEGNAMFTESLDGYMAIPEATPPFYNRWPMEGLVRPVFDLAYWFVVGPIPRALWTSKPIDGVWLWYNELLMRTTMSGGTLAGTNITQSYPGHFFFRYGFVGVVQGGLFFGLLAGFAERILRSSQGRILSMLFALALVTWLFRSFRSPDFQNLYPILIGLTAVTLLAIPFSKVRAEFDD
jgi:hypothetical protein